MEVTETLNSGLKREFKVVVNAAELAKDVDVKLKDLAGRAQIKGFRPGKVPTAHLKSLYFKSLMAEVVQATVDAQARKVFSDRNLKPAYQPEARMPDNQAEVDAIIEGKGDLAFSVAAEIVPEFEVQDFSGLNLERHLVVPDKQHIDEALGRIAYQYKSWKAKDEGTKAEKGDKVIIDFVGTINDEDFEGGTGEDIPLEIGSNQFIPGFEDQLVGTSVGEKRIVSVAFPTVYVAEHLAGKAADFAVTIKAIEVPVPVEINDEFCKRVGFDDTQKMIDNITSSLEREFGNMTAIKLKRDVLDAMDKQYSFDLPERLVESEFNAIWQALAQEMDKVGKSFVDEGTTEEEARKEYQAIAARRVRLGLVLGTIGEKQGVQVTDQEMQQALISRARQFPGQERQVFEHYRKNGGALLELRGPIFEQKVVDIIVASAKITEKPISRDDLKKLIEADEEEAVAAA